MTDDIDWSLTTFEGNRRRQHEEFRALPFREKLKVIEQLSTVMDFVRRESSERDGGAAR
jgi:hypothetical protein